ncbi:hypothetical protein U9M48_020076 [Paspalum notatum var. saurae]|uniref:Dolichol phosphate-mannose biosynthesis regulatory protein n=1 Tax=Paspalum notatum var. saurae TaxID=547442 RepID=A0AAQ3TEB9_PASNO
MELGDKAVGFLLTLTSLSIFTYYTFWVIILPFVDSDHFVHKYFLPQDYAILIPVFAGVVLLSFLSVFVGLVMFKPERTSKYEHILVVESKDERMLNCKRKEQNYFGDSEIDTKTRGAHVTLFPKQSHNQEKTKRKWQRKMSVILND